MSPSLCRIDRAENLRSMLRGLSFDRNSATRPAGTERAISRPTRRAVPQAVPRAARAVVQHATDESWAVAGAMELKADAYDVAYDRFRKAVELRSGNVEALAGLTDAAAGAHRQDEERAWLRHRSVRRVLRHSRCAARRLSESDRTRCRTHRPSAPSRRRRPNFHLWRAGPLRVPPAIPGRARGAHE